MGAHGNRLGHVLTREVRWQPMRPAVDRARRTVLGLPRAPSRSRAGRAGGGPTPVLYGYSRHVLPLPPDWGEGARATGYWFFDAAQAWVPPPDLASFLAAGPPPIVGSGSMADQDAEATTRLVVAALRDVGARAVLLKGWNGLDAADLGPHVHVAGSVPHGGYSRGPRRSCIMAARGRRGRPFAPASPPW